MPERPWNPYFDRVIAVAEQFWLARFSLANFRDDPDAIARYLDEQRALLSFSISALANFSLAEKSIELLIEHRRPKSRHLADAENRLNQNELTLLVALFESEMKNIHREILRVDPKRLREDRQVPLGKLVALGYDVVLAIEIEREIEHLDRESVGNRATYWKDRLEIPWQQELVPLVKMVSDLRNTILHDNPDLRITEDEIAWANVIPTVPALAFTAAQSWYSDRFYYPPRSNP